MTRTRRRASLFPPPPSPEMCYAPHPMPPTAIAPEITMRALLEMYPGAQRALFRKYHIGGCASCGFQESETLAGVCQRNAGLPLDEVIAHLHASQEEDERLQMTPGDVAAARETARLLDIRTREEFDAVHIEGAIHFTQELMQEMLAKWDRRARLVIIDHTGSRSMDAAAYFAGHNFENVRSLRGGIDAWSREIDPSLPRYHLEDPKSEIK